MNIIKPSISLKSEPNYQSLLETECLFGETFEIINEEEEWCYGKLLSDNYYGWVKKIGLGHLNPATHRIITKRTFVLVKSSEKSKSIHYLPMGALVSVKSTQPNWVEISLSQNHSYKTGFLPKCHIVKINHKVKDWVFFAEQLVNTPYRWGGRDTIGIDCSALLQLSYQTFGENIARNTNEQNKIKKKYVKDLNNLDRGYVIFWRGHVGIMVDKINCLHANAFHMKTIIEPLVEIINRMPSNSNILKILNFNE